ncbi:MULTISPECIES: helix-turn-helix domain-containing protein [unclassified Algibacter]|uniref:helix-turn-helix domain-containing protein n=1 Tax=unclassified Algibacter TaxID=2615009 RepID=UPI00131E83FB|nr:MULTISPECIES: helix-turn-helix transcriptional regulator [unclassified Algibacter]MCL5127875.1 helix-turn-helix domain-containing protein [Algibacter sp. L4_22]
MINSEAFIKRLQKVMEYYGESASSFAEKISVQRSSISHILSGRNKPSLEFVLKTLTAFPEVELYWLMNGKGSFPAKSKTEEETKTPSLPPNNNIQTPQKTDNIQNSLNLKVDADKTIERIVVFYSDGSFKNYQN